VYRENARKWAFREVKIAGVRKEKKKKKKKKM
jgi:hypothetical protein